MSVPQKIATTLAGNAEVSAGRRIAALFDEHARMVLAICRRQLRDLHDAEDAAQQTFLSAYRSLLGGANPENAAGWLATIARNECRTRIARRLSAPATVPLLHEPAGALVADVHLHAERRAELDALTTALAELPERQREAVVLRDLYGLSYGEVAAAMTASESAVESLLSRARRTLERRVAPVRVVPGVLVVPGSLREDVARLVPGFAPAESAAAAAGGGAAAVLAKFASIPVGGKGAAAAAAAALAVAVPVAVDGVRDGSVATHGADAAVAAVAKEGKTSAGQSSMPAAWDRPADRRRAARVSPPGRASSAASASGSTNSGSGSTNSDSGSSKSGSANSGSGSANSGSGSTSSGSGSTNSGSGSTNSGSTSTNSGSGSTSSASSGSTTSGSGSTSSGSGSSGSGSTSSGSTSTSSGSGSTNAGSGSTSFGSSLDDD